MIFRNSNQCNLRMVLIKLAMYNFQHFPLTGPTYNCQVSYNSFSLFLNSTWPFITEPFSFHLQFYCAIFFHTTTTKTFIGKPIFWSTTFIALYIQIQAKGRLNKLLPLLLIFGCFRSIPLYDSCWLKGNLKDCYAGHLFFFIFSYPLQFF